MDKEDKKTVLISLVLIILILICFIFYQRSTIKDLKSRVGDDYSTENSKYTNEYIKGFYQYQSDNSSEYNGPIDMEISSCMKIIDIHFIMKQRVKKAQQILI